VCGTRTPLWCDFFLLAPPYAPSPFLLIVLVQAGSMAQENTQIEGAKRPPSDVSPGCVSVVVDGQAALSYDCLSQQMQPKAGTAPGAPGIGSEAIIQKGPNAMGLVNPATSSNRMGSNFGTSAYPQRPPRPSAPSPFCAAESLRKQPALSKPVLNIKKPHTNRSRVRFCVGLLLALTDSIPSGKNT